MFQLRQYYNAPKQIYIVTKIDLDKRRVFFGTTCKVKNKIVIDGEAELYVPKDK